MGPREDCSVYTGVPLERGRHCVHPHLQLIQAEFTVLRRNCPCHGQDPQPLIMMVPGKADILVGVWAPCTSVTKGHAPTMPGLVPDLELVMVAGYSRLFGVVGGDTNLNGA